MLDQEFQQLEERVTREKFVAWLESYENCARVGLACMACACPIAQYLMSTGYSYVSVDHRCIQAGKIIMSMPVWVEAFVARADTLANRESITKAEAMRFLSEIDE